MPGDDAFITGRCPLCGLWGLLVLLLAACAGPATAVPPTAPPVIDEETGLLLNPQTIPAGEFIVEGCINAFTLVPQDAPLFKISADNGQSYQINAQPVADILMVDGRALRPVEFQNGMRARATVFQGDAGGLGGEPVLSSRDLTILDLGEE